MKRVGTLKGFTVVELTVVIAVIGILVSIVAIGYGGFQDRTRDSERASDVALMRIAIEKYYADNSQYPAVCAGDGTACTVDALDTELEPYLPNIPEDPSGTVNEYEYIRGGTSGNAYAIKVKYEAKPECKTGIRVVSTWWSPSIPVCD